MTTSYFQLQSLNAVAAWVIGLMLTVLIAQSMAKLTWNYFNIDNRVPRSETIGSASKPVIVADVHPVEIINTLGLFGVMRVASQEPLETPDTTIKTAELAALDVQLTGLWSSTNQLNARALVTMPTGEERMVKQGDQLADHVKVDVITSDGIILVANMQRRQLTLHTIR